jgi:hypothetical protein
MRTSLQTSEVRCLADDAWYNRLNFAEKEIPVRMPFA